MQQLRLTVPTYNGRAFPKEIERGDVEEYGDPRVPILIAEQAGMRIILGTHDAEDREMPDVLIERRPAGWAIYLHPQGGDPIASVYMLDTGECMLLPEPLVISPIELLAQTADEPREIDRAQS